VHIGTFRDFNSHEWLIKDLVFVFGGPLLLALPASLLGISLDKDIANVFVTSLSILAGLLFNLLVLAHSLRDTITSQDKLRIHLLRSAYANISFSILIAVFTIFLIAVFVVLHSCRWDILLKAISFVTFYSALLFLITLLIVLKRFHSLLWREIGSDERSSDGESE
jgi:hypothetical protein